MICEFDSDLIRWMKHEHTKTQEHDTWQKKWNFFVFFIKLLSEIILKEKNIRNKKDKNDEAKKNSIISKGKHRDPKSYNCLSF